MTPAALPSPIARVQAYFESISPQSLADLDTLYAPDACFKDPFNEVRGVEPIRRIFEHMYTQVETPRFVVTSAFGDERQGFLAWDFRFLAPRLGAGEQVIRGATHLCFTSDGRIASHRDYWDAAEELYAKLPLIGRLMRWLQKRAAT